MKAKPSFASLYRPGYREQANGRRGKQFHDYFLKINGRKDLSPFRFRWMKTRVLNLRGDLCRFFSMGPIESDPLQRKSVGHKTEEGPEE